MLGTLGHRRFGSFSDTPHGARRWARFWKASRRRSEVAWTLAARFEGDCVWPCTARIDVGGVDAAFKVGFGDWAPGSAQWYSAVARRRNAISPGRTLQALEGEALVPRSFGRTAAICETVERGDMVARGNPRSLMAFVGCGGPDLRR